MRTLSTLVALSSLAACTTETVEVSSTSSTPSAPVALIVALEGAPIESIQAPGLEPEPRYESQDGSIAIVEVSEGWDPGRVLEVLRADDRVAWAERDTVLPPASRDCSSSVVPNELDVTREICEGPACWTSDLVIATDVAVAQDIPVVRIPRTGRDASIAEDAVIAWATEAGVTLADLLDCLPGSER